jgi:hypothetical protein
MARTSFAEDLLHAKRLVAPFKLRPKATDNVYLVHAAGLAQRSPAGIFRDWLLGAARKAPVTKRF